MLISTRQAAARLATVGLTRRQAQRVLTAGFAGTPTRTTSALLHREAEVAALAGWPLVEEAVVDAACPSGVFVARRDVDLATSREEQLAGLSGGWDLSPYTAVWIRVILDRDGQLPFVATVCGFVALGADITQVLRGPGGRCLLELRAPGAWFESLRGVRFPTGPGRDWVLRGLPFRAATIRRRRGADVAGMGGWRP